MRIKTVTVTDEQITAVAAWIRSRVYISAIGVAKRFQLEGVPWSVPGDKWVAYEASNRLLQIMRKAGVIERIPHSRQWKVNHE